MKQCLKVYGYRIALILILLISLQLLFRLDMTDWIVFVVIAALVTLPLEIIFYGLERGKNPQVVRNLERIEGVISAICWLIVATMVGIL